MPKVPKQNTSLRWWETLLADQGGVLTTCHPHQLDYSGNSQVLYLSKTLVQLVAHVRGLWGKGTHRPCFLVVWHRESTPKKLAEKGLGITLFHRFDAVKRVTIPTETCKEQIAFYPYCSVCCGNITTTMSHLRQHLDFEFICGMCLASTHMSILTLSSHLLYCGARKKAKTSKSMCTTVNA